jgi:hypothetical protein
MNQFHLLAIFCQKNPYGFLYNDEIELNSELEHAIFFINFFDIMHHEPHQFTKIQTLKININCNNFLTQVGELCTIYLSQKGP